MILRSGEHPVDQVEPIPAPRKRKRRLRKADTVNVADYKNIAKLIPYKF